MVLWRQCRNGRIKDDGSLRLRTALRAIVQRFRPEVRLTPAQDLLLCDLDGLTLSVIEALLTNTALLAGEGVQVRMYSLACPAIPTCGLAISESERLCRDA